MTSAYSAANRLRLKLFIVAVVLLLWSAWIGLYEPIEIPSSGVKIDVAVVMVAGDEDNNSNDNAPRREAFVAAFVCNNRYAAAVANSIASLRKDGNYHGDVLVILDESQDYADHDFPKLLTNEHTKEGLSDLDMTLSVNNTFVFTASELMNDLELRGAKSSLLVNPPEAVQCMSPHRSRGHISYDRRVLIYHPRIAERWDRVLYMDACMTFRHPYVNAIFQLPVVTDALLAMPDPWIWRNKLMKGSSFPCKNETQFSYAQFFVQHGFFNSALILFDSRIVRTNTFEEILKLYHDIGQVFDGGDQIIQSIYWIHMRRKFRTYPQSFLDSNYVPYAFLPQIQQKHVVTAGHARRPTCLMRPTNNKSLAKFHGV